MVLGRDRGLRWRDAEKANQQAEWEAAWAADRGQIWGAGRMITPPKKVIVREIEAFPQFKDRPDVCIRRIRDRF